ncbi:MULTISPECIES: hypothetical protein [Halobacteriovorax]|uniref:Uncharacterized protein n=2 Tax=Halobacteriovorax TaxID=1652133 RepID=A0ABY0ILY2_9BACT|nr:MULTISPECIES: hypothetical protein [Halobacteriovorax]RZF22252.1 hypothetical protein DAY19_00355 [Halobacteriovorax vibrionivorans]TGD48504.1 hypothetical protein EP118_03270 [Halobacteriovorax sp. Y22]
MILKLLISLILFSFNSYALEAGHCISDYSTKRYIQNDFSAPYPKEVIFTCRYRCLDLEGYESEEILGTSTITVNSLSDDALKVVCQGVIVKKSKWGYEYSRTDSFYAHFTEISEIKDWANKNIPLDNSISKKLLRDFKKTITSVYQSYEIAGRSNTPVAKEFSKAAQVLKEMANQLPEDQSLFNLYRKKIEDLDGKTGKDFNSEKLIMDQILFGARWSINI